MREPHPLYRFPTGSWILFVICTCVLFFSLTIIFTDQMRVADRIPDLLDQERILLSTSTQELKATRKAMLALQEDIARIRADQNVAAQELGLLGPVQTHRIEGRLNKLEELLQEITQKKQK